MKNRFVMGTLLIGSLLIALVAVSAVHGASSRYSPYDSDEGYPTGGGLLDDESEDPENGSLDDSLLLDNILQQGASKRSPLIQVYRRACIRRGGNCDHRSNDCCYNSSCRCNLWGSNCRCQRMGLFQKWG